MIDLSNEVKKIFPKMIPPRLELFHPEEKPKEKELEVLWMSDPSDGKPLLPAPVEEETPPQRRRTYDGLDRVERRRKVIKYMRIIPELNSEQIAKKMGLPRGTIIHDIWWARDNVPELKDFGRKRKRQKPLVSAR